MLRRMIIVPLILGLAIPIAAQAPAQIPATPLDRDAAKIRSKVEDLGVGHQITVKLKNGDDFHGAVSKIDPTSFEIAEVDLRQAARFFYSEVKSVRGDYGRKNIWGQRVNPKTATIVTVSVLGGLIALVAVAIRGTR